jgi:hypothetical protein
MYTKILHKLQRTYMKMLRAYARGLIEKGGALEYKAIKLELKLKQEKNASTLRD